MSMCIPVVCEDGFQMSVQASEGHYCNPRNDVGPYNEVEVGFPSQVESLLLPYIEVPEWKEPTKQVYPRVPVEVIRQVIDKHGGMTAGELPPGVEPVCDPCLISLDDMCRFLDQCREEDWDLSFIVEQLNLVRSGERGTLLHDLICAGIVLKLV